MPKSYAQNPTKSDTPTLPARLKALFFLFDVNRRLIADNLTFEQAIPLSKSIPGSVLKFNKMVKPEGLA